MKLNYLNIEPVHPQLIDYNPLVQKMIGPLLDEHDQVQDLIHTPHRVCNDVVLRQAIGFLEEIQVNQYKTMIVGDYDCDGICSTTLMVRLLQKLGMNPGYYIPNRIQEGYGLSVDLVQAAFDKGYQVIITVDNGVSAHPALELAKTLGILVMVVDHHKITMEVQAEVLYHTQLLSTWFQNQCTSGLVATLMDAMGHLEPYDIALAAIGTIGDVMILKGHNRYLVQEGMKQLNHYRFQPLALLLSKPVDRFDETVIAFNIVPVLNAVGRLNEDSVKVYQMVSYLLNPYRNHLESSAKAIKSINQKRKTLTQTHLEKAKQQIDPQRKVQIILDESFHEGIIGIVAGSLAHQVQIPVLVGTTNEQLYKFSVRSPYLDIYSILEPLSSTYFEAFGGHALACAFSIRSDRFETFREHLFAFFETLSVEPPSVDVIVLDTEDLKHKYWEGLMQFSPFGQGFIKLPVVLNLTLGSSSSIKDIGRKWKVNNANDLSEVVTFSSLKDAKVDHKTIDVIGQLQKGYYGQSLSLLADNFIK